MKREGILIARRAAVWGLVGGFIGLILPYQPYTSLGLAVVLACIGAFIRYLDIPVSKDEVFQALSFVEWKTVREIRDAMNAARGYRGYFRSVNPGDIYLHLPKLLEEGLAEEREREISKRPLWKPGSHQQMEWRRAPQGARERDEEGLAAPVFQPALAA